MYLPYINNKYQNTLLSFSKSNHNSETALQYVDFVSCVCVISTLFTKFTLFVLRALDLFTKFTLFVLRALDLFIPEVYSIPFCCF